MLRFLRLIWESFIFAIQALRSNLLRTMLSLLGVAVGIFAIVAVFTIVNALERTIRQDMSFIGTDVIYIQRFPWQFGGGEYPWWKYFQRPLNTIEEFKFLEKNVQNAQGVTVLLFKRGTTLKHQSNSISGNLIQGVSYQYSKVREMDIDQGRYFTEQEIESGKNVAIIGSEIAETLFPYQSPLNKTIKIKGRKFLIIGTMIKEGSNIFGDISNDIRFIMPYTAFSKLYFVGEKGVEPRIGLKGLPTDDDLVELEGEVRGLMRAKRGLKPLEEDDFSLNRTESFANAITSLFGVITIAGWIIGSFSILVGGFGIANIMFVSVRERTNIIGIQKSLGAKNFFILFQFLFEAMLLSLIGGGVGILLVYLITLIPQDLLDLKLLFGNIFLGLIVASVVGVVSGIIPAMIAARMNPVDAIRAK